MWGRMGCGIWGRMGVSERDLHDGHRAAAPAAGEVDGAAEAEGAERVIGVAVQVAHSAQRLRG